MAAISALKKRVAELEAENADLRRQLAEKDKPAARKAAQAAKN